MKALKGSKSPENYLFVVTMADKEQKFQFYKGITEFAVQTLVGTCCALFRTADIDPICQHKVRAILTNCPTVGRLAIKYINDCWASYHEKDDPYVVEKIDALVKLGYIEHVSCIFSLIVVCCESLINCLPHIPINETTNVNQFRQQLLYILNNLTEHITAEHTKDTTLTKCDGTCKVYQYKKGETFAFTN